MAKIKRICKMLAFLSIMSMLVQTASCGFILYPERKGSTGGRIDPGVAILDAILLLPGILPGVIAFAVDFVTGCIYIPYGSVDIDGFEQDGGQGTVAVDGQSLDIEALERILSKHTGREIHIDKKRLTVLRVNDPDFITSNFKKLGNNTSFDDLAFSEKALAESHDNMEQCPYIIKKR